MINNLRELNETINDIVNYIVKKACESTTSGQKYIAMDDIFENFDISYVEFTKFKNLIFSELEEREEILEFEFDSEAMEFDVNCALDYCPSYEWCEGDEVVFGCSYEDWLNKEVLEVSQPLSLSRLAEIGQKSFDIILNPLTDDPYALMDDLGLTDEELVRCGLEEFVFTPPENKFEFFVSSTGRNPVTTETVNSIDEAIKMFEHFTPLPNESKILHCNFDDGYDSFSGDLLKCVNGNYNVFEIHSNLNDSRITGISELYLAAVKAAQVVYPFEESLWAKRTELEKKLGIYDRDTDSSKDLVVSNWRVHLVKQGEYYGLNNCLTHDKADPLVEFIDMSVDKEKFPEGQFVSRYYMSTLLTNNYGSSIKEMAEKGHRFGLDGNVPAWTVENKDLKVISEWLENQNLLPDLKRDSLEDQIFKANQSKTIPEKTDKTKPNELEH